MNKRFKLDSLRQQCFAICKTVGCEKISWFIYSTADLKIRASEDVETLETTGLSASDNNK